MNFNCLLWSPRFKIANVRLVLLYCCCCSTKLCVFLYNWKQVSFHTDHVNNLEKTCNSHDFQLILFICFTFPVELTCKFKSSDNDIGITKCWKSNRHNKLIVCHTAILHQSHWRVAKLSSLVACTKIRWRRFTIASHQTIKSASAQRIDHQTAKATQWFWLQSTQSHLLGSIRIVNGADIQTGDFRWAGHE